MATDGTFLRSDRDRELKLSGAEGFEESAIAPKTRPSLRLNSASRFAPLELNRSGHGA